MGSWLHLGMVLIRRQMWRPVQPLKDILAQTITDPQPQQSRCSRMFSTASPDSVTTVLSVNLLSSLRISGRHWCIWTVLVFSDKSQSGCTVMGCVHRPHLWMWSPYVDLDRNMHEWPAFCRVLGVLLLILLEQRKQVQLQGCCTVMVPCTSTVLAGLLVYPLCSWYCFGRQRIPSGKGWYGCTRGPRTRAWRSYITWANSMDCRGLILPLVVKRKGKTSQKSVRKDKDTEMPFSYKAISK